MADGVGDLRGLSDERKRALLSELLARRGLVAQYPLSAGQRALWFVHRLEPSSPAYNVAARWRIESRVDIGTLRRAVGMLVDRHAVLRTTFEDDDGEPIQCVHASVEVPVGHSDGSGWAPTDVETFLEAEACRPFDLGAEPAVRVHVVDLGPALHVLQFTFHHIVYDLRSGAQLARELPICYAAAARGEACPLAPVATSFVDHVRWQRQVVGGPGGERSWAYWERQLADLPTLDLPTDRPRPSVQTYSGSSLPFTLPADLAARVRAIARRQRTTPYTVLLAVFALWLHRHTAQADVVVGSPGWGRSRAEFDEVVGYFVNPLVLRIGVSPAARFDAFVSSVRETVLAAMDHGDYPFPLLVERLQPTRDPSRSPLFQVAFTWNKLGLLDRAPDQGPGADGLVLRHMGGGQQGANFDLELAISEAGDVLGGWWRYNTDLFARDTIERFERQYRCVLEAALAAPSARLVELPLVTDDERRDLLQAWNAGGRERAGSARQTLVARFEDAAARRPAAPALTFEGATLSYAELDAAANRLAHVLMERGAGPDTRVGLYVERSASLIIGLIAILKTGAAYVPVDASYPADRVRFILDDAAVDAVVTERALRASLETGPVEMIVLEDEDASRQDRPAGKPDVRVRPDSLAYVIYTSGSTGRPKGVGVTHRSAVGLFESTAHWFGFDDADVWTMFHSPAFDFSVWEIWGALLHGGRLVVVPYWVSRSPDSFRGLLADERVTVLNQTPSAFGQLIDADERSAAGPLRLRYVIFGGEALEMRALRPWVRRHGADVPRLVNMYGITETTVHVTYRPLTEADILENTRSVIGEPIPDLALYLLDQNLEPTPIGMRGELFVGGRGVASGYLGRPRLTAERFIPDAWSGVPGARVYRSGDRGRRLADGDVEYLGRIDHQIKIRGFRIELGEIEQALSRHPAVRDAVVMAASDGAGDTRLAAYVVPDPRCAAPVRTLLAWQRDGRLAGRHWRELPNGLAVVELNRNETDFLYQEIFVDGRYLQHGISLPPDACVFDVGANIGMFSLYVGRQCSHPVIYAFEPIPVVADLLELNAELHGLQIRTLACGLASEEGEADFTFYPNVSIFSSRFGSRDEERAVAASFIRNSQTQAGDDPELLNELLEDRLRSETVTCPLTTVSATMKAHGVERIDLLKVDVEKSELSVLEGVDDEDWPKISQVLVEVHDQDGRLTAVTSLLERQGFRTTTEQDPALAQTGLYSVYAVRPGAPEVVAETAPARWSSPARLVEDLRGELGRVLPQYMVPSGIVLLDALPLTSNGKLDRKALPSVATRHQEIVPPRTPIEAQIAAIWREVLKVDQVGVTDDFFALGGHSLLATKVVSQLRAVTSIDVPLRTLFEAPTIEALAMALVQLQAAACDPDAFDKVLTEIEGR